MPQSHTLPTKDEQSAKWVSACQEKCSQAYSSTLTTSWLAHEWRAGNA